MIAANWSLTDYLVVIAAWAVPTVVGQALIYRQNKRRRQ